MVKNNLVNGPPVSNSERESGMSSPAKITKIQSYLSVGSSAIAILGAVGTGFVWAAATLYTGTIELKSQTPLDELTIKVFDQKGEEHIFHSRKLSLMPGHYHLAVNLPGSESRHFQSEVEFQKTTLVDLDQVAGQIQWQNQKNSNNQENSRNQAQDKDLEKRHWWQFWRKKKSHDQDYK